MKKLKEFAAAAALLFAFATVANAATVTLSNGDHVTGELRGVRDGQLVLATPNMGEVLLDLDAVAKIETDQPVAVWLASGDRAVGRIEPGEAGQIRLKAETGDLLFPVSQLMGISAAPADTPSDIQRAIDALAEKAEPKSPWSAQIEFGANYSAGNTDRKGFHVTFDAKRETPDDIFGIRAMTLYAEEDGSRTVNEQHLRFREDIKFDPWYVFALLAFERDEFEDLNLRAILAPGIGRVLSDTEDLKAKVEVGPSLTYEDYDTGGSDYTFQIRFGFFASKQVFDNARITEELEIYPGVNSGIQWRIVSETSFENKISEDLFFKLTVRNDYNTDVPAGVDRWDVKVLASVVYQF